MSKKKLIINLMIVAVSTAARLFGTVALFALLARAVGPADFGRFSYWYAVAVVVGAITDYGFSQQVLKDISAASVESAQHQLAELSRAKAWLALVCSSLVLAYVFAATENLNEVGLAVLLVGGGVGASYFDFFGLVLRARKAYRAESFASLCNSVGGSLLAGVAAYFSHSAIVAALVLLVVRLFSVVALMRFLRREVLAACSHAGNSQSPIATLIAGRYFAFDNVATQMFGSLDALVVKHLLDPTMTGIYLAGTRLVQASLAGIPVIASVFLPAIVRAESKSASLRMKGALLAFAALAGAVVASMFLIGRNWLPTILFGGNFSALSELLPYFGAFVLFRYMAAAPGISLTANGRQLARAVVTATSLCVAVLCGAGLRISHGSFKAEDICIAMALAALVQAALYAMTLMKSSSDE